MRLLAFIFLLMTSLNLWAMPFLGGGDNAPGASALPAKSAKKVATGRNFAISIGREFRYERGSNFNYIDRAPMSLHLAYSFRPIWTARLEVAQFSSSSGNETLSYQRRHTDLLAWLDWKPSTTLPLKPYLSAGAGFYRESITTKFSTEQSVSNSEPGFIYGATGGLEMQMGRLALAGELRFLGGEVDPNPLASGLIRIGIQF